MTAKKTASQTTSVEDLILEVRGQRVLLDEHLAGLYGVPTKRLNEQVTRNRERFPADFMFRLNPAEWRSLRSQFATSNILEGRGGRRYSPRVFTEQGVAMLSSVLRSTQAVEVNIAIMRAFVQLRQLSTGHAELLGRLDRLEGRVGAHDTHLRAVFAAIRKLIRSPPDPERKRIGFDED